MLTHYSFYKWSIIVCTCIMLGFFLLFPKEIVGGYTFRFMVAVYGFVLWLTTLTIKDPEYKKKAKRFNFLFVPFCICVLAECVNTIYLYKYSVYELCIAVMPYLYIFFTYPLLYIFCVDNGFEKTLRNISICTLVALAIKAFIWLVYIKTGTVIFRQLLLEFGDGWVRNGRLRVFAGYLVGFALAYCTYRGFIKNQKAAYKLAVVFIVLFLWFITAYRFQFIAAIITIFMILYLSGNSTQSQLQNRIAVGNILHLFIFSPFAAKLIDSFRISDSSYGSSTSIRLLTIYYFSLLMKIKKAFWGLGLLIRENPLVENLLQRTSSSWFYLEDIGVLGTVFRFGVLALGIYGGLFYYALKSVFHSPASNDKTRILVIGIAAYMLSSCLLLNVFDLQRAFDAPFYFAVFCFYCFDNTSPQKLSPDTEHVYADP